MLVTSAGTSVEKCEVYGGGMVVRLDRHLSAAESRLVTVEYNVVSDACGDGIICEGPTSNCAVDGNVVRGSHGCVRAWCAVLRARMCIRFCLRIMCARVWCFWRKRARCVSLCVGLVGGWRVSV